MKRLLIHGCYDLITFQTLQNLGVTHFSFDLRARSPNLITFRELKELFKAPTIQEVFLTFENDRKETVLSVLNLLEESGVKFKIIFRDFQDSDFYHSLGIPFFWMFHPDGPWEKILKVEELQGVFLPTKWTEHYEAHSGLWAVMEERKLDIYLHAESFNEAMTLDVNEDIDICIDLTAEVENGVRKVDQEKLKKMPIWRKQNENIIGQ